METKPKRERHYDYPEFYDCYTGEQYNRTGEGTPSRQQRMMAVIVETYKTTKAQDVAAFVKEAHEAIRMNQRLTVSESEVQAYVMLFLWSALTEARAEIAKFPERMRKRRSE